MLKIQNLDIRVAGRNTPLVRGINATVSPGRPLILMGETGCGKSLIAQAVFRLLPPGMTADGSIRYRGRNLLETHGAAVRSLWGKDIFLFPQEPAAALNPLRRSKFQVTEIFRWVANGVTRNGSRSGPLDYDRLWRDGFRQLGLAVADGRKYPWQLSGGMNQRLLTVMALAEPARLVVADEPTKGLDPQSRDQAIGLLARMNRAGKGLFVITHDPELPRQLGGDLAVMYAGTVMEAGPARQVLDHPAHPYTQALVNALPENGLHPIPLQVNGNRVNGGCPFSSRCVQALPDCFDTRPCARIIDDQPLPAPAGSRRVQAAAKKIQEHVYDPSEDHTKRIIRCHRSCQG